MFIGSGNSGIPHCLEDEPLQQQNYHSHHQPAAIYHDALPAVVAGEVMKADERVDRTLDATGLACPEPVFRARQCLSTMQAGQVLEVLCDDPLGEIDLAVFCERTGHELLASDQAEGRWTFLLRKAAG